VPTDADGALRIYYSERNPRRYISAIDVLAERSTRCSAQQTVPGRMTGLAATDYQKHRSVYRCRQRNSRAIAGERVRPDVVEEAVLGAGAGTRGLCAARPAAHLATPRWKPLNAALLATACVVLPALAAFSLFHSRRQLYDRSDHGLGLLILFTYFSC